MTALRIVQRMKKDSLHSGRRPTGLCGAGMFRMVILCILNLQVYAFMCLFEARVYL